MKHFIETSDLSPVINKDKLFWHSLSFIGRPGQIRKNFRSQPNFLGARNKILCTFFFSQIWSRLLISFRPLLLLSPPKMSISHCLRVHHHNQSVLPKGRSCTAGEITQAAALPKAGLPPQTQEPRLLFYPGLSRCGSFALLSAVHSLFSIWTDLQRSEKIPGSPTSQLILQPFRCFTYVTVHSPTLISLFLRHKIFT